MSSIESGTIRTALPNGRLFARVGWYSKTNFLTEFDLHLVDLTFVPRVHNVVRMGLRGVDESLFPIIAPELLDEPFIPTVQKPRFFSLFG
jgi:hypothetical protein